VRKYHFFVKGGQIPGFFLVERENCPIFVNGSEKGECSCR